MPTGALVSVEEYLANAWSPDRDYIEGELLERNMGELSHGRLQLRIGAWLFARESRLRFKAVIEVRLQVKPNRFRVPDLMVLRGDAPREEIVPAIPLLCIEILSKDDSMIGILERIQDYLDMGVPTCWIIDPIHRQGWVATSGHLAASTDGILRADDIEMPLAEVVE